MAVFNWLLTNIIGETSLFMGIIAALGLIVQKKPFEEVIEGALLTSVGYIIFNSASDLIIPAINGINKILLPSISSSAGINASSDYLITFAMTVDWIAQNVMIAFIVAWFLHILVVKVFNKWFKAVYLTIHVQIGWTAAFMIFSYCNLHLSAVGCYVFTIVMDVLVWSIGPMLTYKTAMDLSGGAFAMGHYVCFSAALCGLVAPAFGDPEKDDADNLELPGWLSMFGNNVLAQAIAMPIFFIIIVTIVLIIGNADSLNELTTRVGSYNWIIYCVLQGFKFAAGNAILMQGLRMFLGSIIPSFQGFTEKLLPGVVPAIDFVAFFGFAPMAVLFGFIGFATSGFVAAIVNVSTGIVPAFVYPNVALSFFNGGALGVFCNKKGGWKAALILPFILGFIMHIGAGFIAGYLPEMAATGYGVGSVDPVVIMSLLCLILGKKAV